MLVEVFGLQSPLPKDIARIGLNSHRFYSGVAVNSHDSNHFKDKFRSDVDTAQISEASKKKSPQAKRKRIASERELYINA